MSITVKLQQNRLPKLKAHEALAIGDLVGINTDGEYQLADASSDGLSPAYGVVTMAAAEGGYPEVCRNAVIENSAWSFDVGKVVYVSGTAGATTKTLPATTGDVDQIVGVAIAATKVAFDIHGFGTATHA